MNEEPFTQDYVSPHLSLWAEVLAPFAGKPSVQGLEIGSFEGRSACWFLDHILTGPGASLTCVDPWTAAPGRERRFDANTRRFGDRIRKCKASGLGFCARRVGAGRREFFDFIYIDGDHRAESVLADSVLAWPLLKRGGVLIWDDYGEAFQRPYLVPRVAIDGFLACRTDWKLLHEGYQKVVRKT